MLDLFSWIYEMMVTGFLFILFFFLAIILVPVFSSQIFHGHLSPSKIRINIAICCLLILLSLFTYYICYSSWQSILIEALGPAAIDILESGRFWSSVILFVVHVLDAVILGALDIPRRLYQLRFGFSP